MAITMRIDYRLLSDRRVVLALVTTSLLLVGVTLVPGIGKMVNGSRRWLRYGMLSFQPSELAKFAFVVYMSYYIAKKGERLRDFMNGLLPAYVMCGVFLGLAALQPDFGTAMTIAGVTIILLFAGGGSLLQLGGTVLEYFLLCLLPWPTAHIGGGNFFIPRSLGGSTGRGAPDYSVIYCLR